ncbi:Nn.00g082190.m01.CDS01 [Neocucurbitaria sp. VM-36]
MSSLTSQESSETQPDNPINPGTADKSSHGQDDASGTSEQRSGEDITQSTKQESQGSGEVGKKSGGGSLMDSVEKSVHDRGEAEQSRADARD